MANEKNVSPTPKVVAAKLSEVERKEGRSGAIPLTPKRMLLDASDVAAAKPDKRLRWVNIRNKEKAEIRVADGYRRIPEDEGGRSLGEEMALFELPRPEYEKRVAKNKQLMKDRQSAHRREWENHVDSIARELRDKHGHQVNVDRLIKE